MDNGWKALNILAKRSILNVWLVPEYVSHFHCIDNCYRDLYKRPSQHISNN